MRKPTDTIRVHPWVRDISIASIIVASLSATLTLVGVILTSIAISRQPGIRDLISLEHTVTRSNDERLHEETRRVCADNSAQPAIVRCAFHDGDPFCCPVTNADEFDECVDMDGTAGPCGTESRPLRRELCCLGTRGPRDLRTCSPVPLKCTGSTTCFAVDVQYFTCLFAPASDKRSGVCRHSDDKDLCCAVALSKRSPCVRGVYMLRGFLFSLRDRACPE